MTNPIRPLLTATGLGSASILLTVLGETSPTLPHALRVALILLSSFGSGVALVALIRVRRQQNGRGRLVSQDSAEPIQADDELRHMIIKKQLGNSSRVRTDKAGRT